MIDARRIFIISGPSGAGKTSVYKKLLNEFQWLRYSVSMTTRGLRPNEVEGLDYYFVNRKKFEDMIESDEFAEYAEVHGNLYGTLKSELEAKTQSGLICCLDIDVKGAARLRALYPEALKIFIKPPDEASLRARLSNRSTESIEIQELRIANAVKELEEERFFDYSVINRELETAYNEVRAHLLRRKGALEHGDSL